MIEIDYLDKLKSDKLISKCSNIKHKTIMLIMLDCGLRVTETVTLKFSNFDFKAKTVRVKSLKKRSESVFRVIPLSDRLYSCLAEYISKNHKNINGEDFIFPGLKDDTHISRMAVNKFMAVFKHNNTGYDNLHPHALRHTFATHQVVNGTPLHDVKYMLGHTRYDTTTIYTHTPVEILRQRINKSSEVKLNFWDRVKAKFNNTSRPTLINLSVNSSDFIIGRNAELTRVIDLINKNCNVILIGGIGIGKSHIISHVTPNRKTLKIDDCSDFKKTLIQLLVYLYKNDKEAIMELLYPQFDLTKLEQHLTKDSVKALCEHIIKITSKHEYLLIIDNVDRITPKSISVLEYLKDHFTILTSAREVPINKQSFLWNFEVIKLENISRQHSLELIHKLAYDLDVEDFELFRNHIYDQSSGNPRVIFELVDRFRKEVVISKDIIRSINHTGALREYDMTFILMLVLSFVAILRYLSSEIDNDSFKFIGGAAMILLLFSRQLFSFTKRKMV